MFSTLLLDFVQTGEGIREGSALPLANQYSFTGRLWMCVMCRVRLVQYPW